jgi:hypothetical protein
MKKLLFLFTMMAISLAVCTNTADAAKKETTEEEAAKMIQERQAIVADLEKKLEAVTAEVKPPKKNSKIQKIT